MNSTKKHRLHGPYRAIATPIFKNRLILSSRVTGKIQFITALVPGIANNLMGKIWHGTWSIQGNSIAIKFMDINEYFLMSCPNMIGFNEGWVIDNHVFVSPAIFQLLTDEDDWQTRMCVARQLVLKQATYKDLKILLENTIPPRRTVRSEVRI